MNDEQGNMEHYNGSITQCSQCVNSPKCSIVGKHATYKWAIKIKCPDCLVSFYICGICIHGSNTYKHTQLQGKRLPKHSVGKTHCMLLEKTTKHTFDQNDEDEINDMVIDNPDEEEDINDMVIDNIDEGAVCSDHEQGIIVNNIDTILSCKDFDREASNRYFQI